jgi:hypothetical protein
MADSFESLLIFGAVAAAGWYVYTTYYQTPATTPTTPVTPVVVTPPIVPATPVTIQQTNAWMGRRGRGNSSWNPCPTGYALVGGSCAATATQTNGSTSGSATGVQGLGWAQSMGAYCG